MAASKTKSKNKDKDEGLVSIRKSGPNVWEAEHPSVTGHNHARILALLIMHRHPHIMIRMCNAQESYSVSLDKEGMHMKGNLIETAMEIMEVEDTTIREFFINSTGKNPAWWMDFQQEDLEADTPEAQEEMPSIDLHSPILDPATMLCANGKGSLLLTTRGEMKPIVPGYFTPEQLARLSMIHGHPQEAAEIIRRTNRQIPQEIDIAIYRTYTVNSWWTERVFRRVGVSKHTGKIPENPEKFKVPPVGDAAIALELSINPQFRDRFFGANPKPTKKFLRILKHAFDEGMAHVNGDWDGAVAQDIMSRKILKEYHIPKNIEERHVLAYKGEAPPEIPYMTNNYWYTSPGNHIGAIFAVCARYMDGNPGSKRMTIALSLYSEECKVYREIIHSHVICHRENYANTSPETAIAAVVSIVNGDFERMRTFRREIAIHKETYPEDVNSEWYQEFENLSIAFAI